MDKLLKFVFLLISVLLAGCNDNHLESTFSKHGYLVKPLDSIFEMSFIGHDQFVFGSNNVYDKNWIIDSIGEKTLLFNYNQFSVLDYHKLYPINDSLSWQIFGGNQGNTKLSKFSYGQRSLLLATLKSDNILTVREIYRFNDSTDVSDISFSPNKLNCFFIEKNPDDIFLNLMLFNYQGKAWSFRIPKENHEEYNTIIINDNFSLWAFYDNKINEKVNTTTVRFFDLKKTKPLTWSKLQIDDTNYFELNNGQRILDSGKSIILTSREFSSSIYILNSTRKSKIISGVEDVFVTTDKQHFFVIYYEKDKNKAKRKIGLFDLDGNEITLDIDLSDPEEGPGRKTELYNDLNSNDAWLRTPKLDHYYINVEKDSASADQISDIHGEGFMYSIGNGKALFRPFDKNNGVDIIDARNDTIYNRFSQLTFHQFPILFTQPKTDYFVITDVRNNTYLGNSSGEILNFNRPIFTSAKVINAYSKDINKRLWFETDLGYFLLINFNAIDFDYNLVQTPNFSNTYLDLKLDLPNRFDSSYIGGRIEIDVRNENGDQVALNSIIIDTEENTNGQIKLDLGWKADFEINWNSRYKILLNYSDDYDSDLTAVMENIYFIKPVWTQKQTNSTILFLTILILISLSQLFKSSLPNFSRWFPILVVTINSFLNSFGEHISLISGYFDSNLLLIYFFILIVVVSFLGYLSPQFFKLIVNIAPFHWITPLVSKMPAFRRRFFKEYVFYLANFINSERQNASNEKYARIPVKLKLKNKETLVLNPTEEILEKVNSFTQNEAPHILIKSPGGQGKSALLREITYQYLERFLKNPNLPIPIYVNATGKKYDDIPELIKQELGRFLISEDFLDAELKSGTYLLIMDGLSESTTDPELIGNFVRVSNEYGINTPFLITLRPNEQYENELSKSQNLINVIPQKLDDNTINIFEEAYTNNEMKLSKAMREICRTEDGFYQPIFVRLALIVIEYDIKDITELYEASIRLLLEGKDASNSYEELLGKSIELCMDSYLKRGAREIVIDVDNKKLINSLSHSGLLVPLDSSNPFGNITKRYKFFHDTIQSYLTVLGVYRKSENLLNDTFYDFATNQFFKNDKANFIFDNGSEVFQLGVLLYTKYGEDLTFSFEEQIRLWAETLKTEYSVRDIVNSTPKKIKNRLIYEGLEPFKVCIITLDECKSNLFLVAEYFHNISQLVYNIQNRQ